MYRALEFLLEHGLVHRVASLNAFIGCAHPGHSGAGQFLICTECGVAAELNDSRVEDSIEALRGVELIRLAAETPELAFMFKHALTHDVAYATLLGRFPPPDGTPGSGQIRRLVDLNEDGDVLDEGENEVWALRHVREFFEKRGCVSKGPDAHLPASQQVSRGVAYDSDFKALLQQLAQVALDA